MQSRLTRVRFTRRTGILAALGVGLAACTDGSSNDGPSRRATTSQSAAGIARQATAAVAASPEQVCLVSRERGLPQGYAPADLTTLPRDYCLTDNVRMRADATRAAIALIDAAWQDGHKILGESGFRTYQEQEKLAASIARRSGAEQANRQVAPPGHSEHQLGLALDVGIVRKPFSDDPAFGTWPEGLWLADNCATFGYVISYPQGKEPVTGYTYEPWHIRFVGPQVAERVRASNLTLTEFLLQNNIASCDGELKQ